nr:hypothetical protein [Halorubrum sp. BOL3-1]
MLADRFDRDFYDVYDDLHLLAEYGIIHFEKDGRAKKPSVPYDTLRLEAEFDLQQGDVSASAVST